MESYIVKAFVKGIFKASGGLLVLGISLFIYDNVNKILTKETKEVQERDIGNGISIGVNSIDDVEVYKTDKDDNGQLYAKGHIFKACGKLNKEKETEETDLGNLYVKGTIFEKLNKETQNKDFKKLFTF